MFCCSAVGKSCCFIVIQNSNLVWASIKVYVCVNMKDVCVWQVIYVADVVLNDLHLSNDDGGYTS